MKSLKSINKRGSYIVEVVITLPLFMVSALVMISIILLFVCIEGANYTLANAMRKEAIQAKYFNGELTFIGTVTNQISGSDSHIQKLTVKDYAYKGRVNGIDQAIAVTYDMKMKIANPLNLASQADYELSLMTRAYVGKERQLSPIGVDGMSDESAEPVFVFPKSGEKYHSKGCTFVHAASTSTPLTRGIERKYGGCKICGSRDAALGSLVYYFPEYGEDYHLTNCSVLERNYIEMDKKIAVKRGYTPCNKCGG